MRAATAILLRSEASRRKRVYALLFCVFLATTTGLSIMLGSVDGIEDAIGQGIRDTVSGDQRIATQRPERMAEGQIFDNASATAATMMQNAREARASPRLEFNAILLHTDQYEDFESGIVVGLDPKRDVGRDAIAKYILSGHFLDAESVWINGTPYPQLVIGEDLAKSMNVTVFGDTLRPSNVVNVTAGRFQDSATRPVVKEGVVVGIFRTGFQPLDHNVVYVHMETARELLRVHLMHDAANVLIVTGQLEPTKGYESANAQEFREAYLYAVFAPVRAFARLVTVVVLTLAAGWIVHVVVDAVASDRARLAVMRALGLPSRLLVAPIALALLAAAAAGTAGGLALGAMIAFALSRMGVRAPGLGELPFVATLPWEAMLGLGLASLLVVTLAAGAVGLAMKRIPVTEALKG